MMYYIVEKLIVSRESVVSTLTLIYTSRVLYALARLAKCGVLVRKAYKSQEAQNEPYRQIYNNDTQLQNYVTRVETTEICQSQVECITYNSCILVSQGSKPCIEGRVLVNNIVRVILTGCMVNMSPVVKPAVQLSKVLFWVTGHIRRGETCEDRQS